MRPRPVSKTMTRRSISTAALQTVRKRLLALQKQPLQPVDRRALEENLLRVSKRLKQRVKRRKPSS